MNARLNKMARPNRQVACFQAHRLTGLDDPFLDLCEQPGLSVFQSRRFMRALFGTIAAAGGAEPVLVGIREASGRPVAFFPFTVRRRAGLRVLEGLDLHVTDYFAPVSLVGRALTSEESNLIWHAVLSALPPVDAVVFKKMPRKLHGEEHALSASAFPKPMGATAATVRLRYASGDPLLSLQNLSVAREIRRKTRKLEAYGAVTFHEATEAAEISEAIDHLVAFRRTRFAELGRADVLTDPHVESFYRELARPEGPTVLGRLFVLRVGSEIVSVVYGFCFGGAFTLIIPSIAPQPSWQAGSPGLVALFKTFEWCMARELCVLDLSVGSMPYKARFDAEEVELFEFQQALTPLGWLVVAEGWARRRVRHLALKYPRVREITGRLEALINRFLADRTTSNA